MADLYLIEASSGDWDYADHRVVAILTDPTVAELVIEELVKHQGTKRKRGRIHHDTGFTVRPLKVCEAESESRVAGIVKNILAQHYPREG